MIMMTTHTREEEATQEITTGTVRIQTMYIANNIPRGGFGSAQEDGELE